MTDGLDDTMWTPIVIELVVFKLVILGCRSFAGFGELNRLLPELLDRADKQGNRLAIGFPVRWLETHGRMHHDDL